MRVQVVTVSDFNLRLSIWSLVNKSVRYIKFPKFAETGLDFSADGRFVAVLERREFVDYCGVYDCENWQLVKSAPLSPRIAPLCSPSCSLLPSLLSLFCYPPPYPFCRFFELETEDVQVGSDYFALSPPSTLLTTQYTPNKAVKWSPCDRYLGLVCLVFTRVSDCYG